MTKRKQTSPPPENAETSSNITKKSAYISYINPNFGAQASGGLLIVSHFLDGSSQSRVGEMESVKSMIPGTAAINVTSSEVSPEAALIKMRNNFIQRVFLILFAQFMSTVILLLLIHSVSPIFQFFHKHGLILGIVSACNYICIAVALLLSTSLRKEFPGNAIMMVLITITFSVMVAGFSWLAVDTVCPFFVFATGIIIIFTIFTASCQSQYDVSTSMAICWAAIFISIVTSVITVILAKTRAHEEFYPVLVAGIILLFYTWWILRTTRRITEEKKMQLSSEDYIFGALALYIQFLFVFMSLIQLIKYCRRV